MQKDTVNLQAAAKLKEKVKKVDIAMLTTEEVDGHLRSRPMHTTQVDDNGVLWFFTSDESGKAYIIEKENCKVNLAYADPQKDTYISISGTADIVEDRAKMEALWNPAMKAWFAQGLDTPDIALVKVSAERAEYWDVTSNKMVQLFAMAKSAITGDSDAARSVGNNEKMNIR